MRPDAPRPCGVVAYSVEHHHGVVERVAEHGEHGHHRVRGHLEPDERVDPHGDQDVVEHRHDGGHRHLELEADRDVERSPAMKKMIRAWMALVVTFDPQVAPTSLKLTLLGVVWAALASAVLHVVLDGWPALVGRSSS